METRQLTTGTFQVGTPSFSPDAKQIAFSRGDGRQSDIFVMDLADGSMRQITFMESSNDSPAWSPDGKQIAFLSSEGGITRAWRVSANGGVARPFEDTDASATNPTLAWSLNGILYPVPGNRNYRLLDPTTGTERLLVDNPEVGWIFDPTPSPDGTRVAVFWNRDREGTWVISLESGLQVFLYEGSMPVRWSGDGKWIYAFEWWIKPARIMRLPVAGGEGEALTTLPPHSIERLDRNAPGERSRWLTRSPGSRR